MEIYTVIEPIAEAVPIVINSPHSGTYFPAEVKSKMIKERVEHPDDTDWFIDELYDFAPKMGITMIKANYNRWVIDLNRDPDSVALYDDGRVITGLVPKTDFNGQPLYKEAAPDPDEIRRRLKAYYEPYHQKVSELLTERVRKFNRALLFDAHSIRKHVSGIRPEPFPDLILGDNDETSASSEIIHAACHVLRQGDYDFQHNHPFKGGYITRHFGNPESNVHALQLEMAKTNYMNRQEIKYHEKRANKIRRLLQELFETLINTI